MHVAARTENGSEVLEYLLKNGAGVNIKGPEASPVLHLAARSGNEAVVKKLIEHGADIDAEVEASGYTGMSLNGLSGIFLMDQVQRGHGKIHRQNEQP